MVLHQCSNLLINTKTRCTFFCKMESHQKSSTVERPRSTRREACTILIVFIRKNIIIRGNRCHIQMLMNTKTRVLLILYIIEETRGCISYKETIGSKCGMWRIIPQIYYWKQKLRWQAKTVYMFSVFVVKGWVKMLQFDRFHIFFRCNSQWVRVFFLFFFIISNFINFWIWWVKIQGSDGWSVGGGGGVNSNPHHL